MKLFKKWVDFYKAPWKDPELGPATNFEVLIAELTMFGLGMILEWEFHEFKDLCDEEQKGTEMNKATKSFGEWLEAVWGMTPEYYDNNCSGEQVREMWNEYYHYLDNPEEYDGYFYDSE